MTTKGPFAELVAVGASQATAAEMNADMVMVTSGSGGVLLPAKNVNDEVIICNGLSENIYVYPRSGGAINNSAQNAPVDLPAHRAVRLKAINDREWIAFF